MILARLLVCGCSQWQYPKNYGEVEEEEDGENSMLASSVNMTLGAEVSSKLSRIQAMNAGSARIKILELRSSTRNLILFRQPSSRKSDED